MKLVNFDLCERPNISIQKHYGGQSGNKEHIHIDTEIRWVYNLNYVQEKN